MLPMWKLLISGMLAVTSMAPGVNGQYPGPGVVTGDIGVHDPTVVKKPDGTYLMAYTGTNVGFKTSTDRTAWTEAGPAFPNGASWTTPYTLGDLSLWAPDISYHDGIYYLYYSASSFGATYSAIFLATSTTGESGSWEHVGLVIESAADEDWNAIDPNLIIDEEGNWWLAFGSWWSGLKMISLDPSTGLRSGTDLLSIASRANDGNAIEAPFIMRNGSYYYLWASFDKCCDGAASTYRIMVGRSTSVTGPYVDQNGVDMMEGGGTEVLAGHDSIHGPGHQAVITDEDGDVLIYHYYADNGASLLGINLLRYDSEWPVAY
ncbi:hypothetical protein FQN50_001977 [Emmonsiellopsis sp. PD_5]|nr:hypothetical protein FQN50_001977 [Emmonsiellopsis sp. PD_5]